MTKLKSKISFDDSGEEVSFKKKSMAKKTSGYKSSGYKSSNGYNKKPKFNVSKIDNEDDEKQTKYVKSESTTEIELLRRKIRSTIQVIFKKIKESEKHLSNDQLISVVKPYIEKVIEASNT